MLVHQTKLAFVFIFKILHIDHFKQDTSEFRKIIVYNWSDKFFFYEDISMQWHFILLFKLSFHDDVLDARLRDDDPTYLVQQDVVLKANPKHSSSAFSKIQCTNHRDVSIESLTNQLPKK